MRLHRSVVNFRLVLGMVVFMLGISLVACGGGSAGAPADSEAVEETAGDNGSGVPTMPAANFAQPTTQIGSAAGASEPVTDTEVVTATESMTDSETLTDTASDEGAAAEDASTDESAAVDDELLTRGENAYNRHCTECHGADGTGVEGEGDSLVGISLSESELSTLLRTGGDLGPEHLFGPQKISPGSLEALYVYLQALSAE